MAQQAAAVTQTTGRSLKQIAAQITENVRALDAGEITVAQFSERQRAAWDAVTRGEQNIIGSACSRRHVRVVRLLGIANGGRRNERRA